MSDDAYIPEPWLGFLSELDEIANEPVDFHCIGGFVVTEKYGFDRTTRDIDVLSISPNTQRNAFQEQGREGSRLHREYRVYLDVVTVIEAYPEDYEARLTELYPGQLKNIRLMVPEAHDLALMKLGRNIERDREDVKYLARRGFITVDELTRRYHTEMRSYIALPERRTDLVLELWCAMIRENSAARQRQRE